MSVARVILYGRESDPYTHRARTLLTMKGIAFVEKPLPLHYDEMKTVTGGAEGPQLVIDGKAIGGFDALGSMDLRGELDRLLMQKPGAGTENLSIPKE